MNTTVEDVSVPDNGTLTVSDGYTLNVSGDLYTKDLPQIKGSVTLGENASLKSTFKDSPLTLISHDPEEVSTFLMTGSVNVVLDRAVEGSDLPSNVSMVITGNDTSFTLKSDHIVAPDTKLVIGDGVTGVIPNGKKLYVFGEVVLQSGSTLIVDEGGTINVLTYDGPNNIILNTVYGAGIYNESNVTANAATFTVEEGSVFTNNGTLAGDGTYPA